MMEMDKILLVVWGMMFGFSLPVLTRWAFHALVCCYAELGIKRYERTKDAEHLRLWISLINLEESKLHLNYAKYPKLLEGIYARMHKNFGVVMAVSPTLRKRKKEFQAIINEEATAYEETFGRKK